jgi:hypothetical protein
MADLWNDRSLPILRELVICDDTDEQLDLKATGEELSCTANQIGNEIERLQRAGYIDAEIYRAMSDDAVAVTGTRVLERGLRELDLWPSNEPYDALIEVIDERLRDLPEASEETTKLKALRAAVVDVGKGAATGVLVALAKHAGGF